MQSSDEISLNTQIKINKPILPKYDYGYWLIVFFSLVMLTFIAGQVFSLIEKDEITLVGNSLKTIIGIVGIIMSYSVTKSLDGDLKHTWKILTWAYIFNTGGDTIWYYYASILNEKPFPSWADVSFLLHYPVMLWALLSYPTRSKGFDKKKFLADISIVMVSGTTLVWYFIIHPTISAITEEDYISPALNLSYTVGDMVLILGILIVFFRGVDNNLKRALQIIVAGVICMLVADLGFAYLTLQGAYFGGHWIENFFIFNSLSHIYAAYYQYKKGQSEAESEEISVFQSETGLINWFPYIAVLLGIILLGWEAKAYWNETLGKVVLSSIVLTVLAVFRQILAVKENVRLVNEQSDLQSEARFKIFFEHSSDLIFLRDESGRTILESPSAKKYFGYTEEELEKQPAFSLVHPEDVKELKESFERLKIGEIDTYKNIYRVKVKDGSWKYLETISKRFSDEAANLSGILVNSRDITQRKQDEAYLQIFTEKLQQSNQELQDFAYVASHDLQEPLRKVQAFGERLNKKYGEGLGDEGRDYIKRMQDAASRMQTLIEGLLTYSRVSTKAQPFIQTDLRQICDEVVSDLEVRIEQTHAQVIISDLPQIDADALQMRQLFQNLISNALKFQPQGTTPIVKIYAETLSDSDACRIYIEDNGIGFDEKYLDRIFGVFQRLHGRSEYEGSGIGLSVCKKIVERHGGEITATSEIGKGATFIITFPLKIEHSFHNTFVPPISGEFSLRNISKV